MHWTEIDHFEISYLFDEWNKLFRRVKKMTGTIVEKGTTFPLLFFVPVENPFRSFYYLWEKAAACVILLLQTSVGNGTQSSINNGLNIYSFKGKGFWCYYFSSLVGERERIGSNQTYFRLTRSDLSVVSNLGWDTEVIHTSTWLKAFNASLSLKLKWFSLTAFSFNVTDKVHHPKKIQLKSPLICTWQNVMTLTIFIKLKNIFDSLN